MKKINALATAVIIFVSVVALSIVYVPRIMGLESYAIESGSMEPTIKTGSVVYVHKYSEFSDYETGDIVTFTNTDRTKFFTHRIIKINQAAKSFETQGDANSEKDLSPTDYQYAVGKVQFVIPYLGFVVLLLKNTITKIVLAVIYIAWLAIEIEIYISERKRNGE